MCNYTMREKPGSSRALQPEQAAAAINQATTTSGVADITVVYGSPNDKPVAGHWTLGGAPAPINPVEPTATPPLAPTFVPRKP